MRHVLVLWGVILTLFAVVTIANWDLGLLAPVQTGLRQLASPYLHDLYGATLATARQSRARTQWNSPGSLATAAAPVPTSTGEIDIETIGLPTTRAFKMNMIVIVFFVIVILTKSIFYMLIVSHHLVQNISIHKCF